MEIILLFGGIFETGLNEMSHLLPNVKKQGLLIVKEYGAGQYNIERKAIN